MGGHLERSAEQRLCRRPTETDERFRSHERNLSIQPRATSCNLRRARLLVNAPLASGLPFEVLHDVGDIDIVARDARLRQRPVQQSACRSDEGMALDVFLVAWLLAHEHQARAGRSLAEDCLRSSLPEVARTAVARGGADGLEGGPTRDPVS